MGFPPPTTKNYIYTRLNHAILGIPRRYMNRQWSASYLPRYTAHSFRVVKAAV